jgi:hypothetical protein
MRIPADADCAADAHDAVMTITRAKHRGGRRRLRLALLLAAVAGSFIVPLSVPEPAGAFCNDPGPSDEEPDRDTEELCHQQMVRASLPFLRETLLAGLDEWVDDADDSGFLGGPIATSDNHFDNCNFDGATERLNARYLVPGPDASRGAVPRMTRDGAFASIRSFGWILHAVEDFYSHSNWVEIATSDGGGDDTIELEDFPRDPNWAATDVRDQGEDAITLDTLVDDGLRLWGHMGSDWDLVPHRTDMVTSQEDDLPDGWRYVDTSGRLRRVRTDEGDERWLLVSGNTEHENPFQDCPDPEMTHNTLNKDNSARRYYEEATYAAVRQTRHEWCRLLHLWQAIAGPEAAGKALGLVVRPGASPHPAGTPCAAALPGTEQVNVEVSDVRVLDDHEDDSPGEINLTFTVFNDDFTRSTLLDLPVIDVDDGTTNDHIPSVALPLKIPVCANVSEDLFASVQAWDDDDDGGARGDFDSDDDELVGVVHDVGRVLTVVGAGEGVGTWGVKSEDMEAELEVDTIKTDEDRDGLPRCDELLIWQTDPYVADSDADGIDDGDEVDAATDPNRADSDGDGLADGRDVEFVQHAIRRLASESLRAPAEGTRQSLLSRLDAVETALLEGDPRAATNALGSLRRHMDGCGTGPDANDSIRHCPDQRAIRTLVDRLMANIA